MENKKFAIFWGIGGGYGGINNSAIIFAKDIDEALNTASSYSMDDVEATVVTDADPDDDYDAYMEEIESWLDYDAEEFTGSEEQMDKLKQYHFQDETA
jgi:hypothetical protein